MKGFEGRTAPVFRDTALFQTRLLLQDSSTEHGALAQVLYSEFGYDLPGRRAPHSKDPYADRKANHAGDRF